MQCCRDGLGLIKPLGASNLLQRGLNVPMSRQINEGACEMQTAKCHSLFLLVMNSICPVGDCEFGDGQSLILMLTVKLSTSLKF